MTTNIFGTNTAATAAVFEEKTSAEFDEFRMNDNVGAHVLLTVKGIEKVATKQYGEKDAVRHDVAVYDINGKVTETASDILTFSAAFVRDLGRYVGQQVFVKIGEYKSKYGRMAPCPVAPDHDYVTAYNASVA